MSSTEACANERQYPFIVVKAPPSVVGAAIPKGLTTKDEFIAHAVKIAKSTGYRTCVVWSPCETISVSYTHLTLPTIYSV